MERDAEQELEQDDLEAAMLEREKLQAENKQLRRKLSLSRGRPAGNEVEVRNNFTGLGLSNVHLGVLVSVLAVLGTVWQLVGVPMTGLRDDVRDIKNNYVRKDDLASLARKSDVDVLRAMVDGHSQAITRFDQLKEQRDREIKNLQDGQAKHDSAISVFEQRLTRLEAFKGVR